MKHLKTMLLSTTVGLASTALLPSASAQLVVTGALPNAGLIIETRSGTPTYRVLQGAELTQELTVLGMPTEIWDICHGAYLDCRPNDAGQMLFRYSWGWDKWFYVANTSQEPGYPTQKSKGVPGGIASFNCTQTTVNTFDCTAGTGGPGFSWIFHAYYQGWWR
jgi:hypothetical protein